MTAGRCHAAVTDELPSRRALIITVSSAMILCTKSAPATPTGEPPHRTIGEPMKIKFRAVTIASVVGVAVAALASPAMAAVSWGTLSSSYNGITRSTASGTFYNDRAVYATVMARLNDTSNDGNNVYVNADEYFWQTDPVACPTNACYVFDRTKESPEYWYSNTPANVFMYNSLHSGATSARASIYTCVQLGWPVPDHCSGRAVVSFAY